MKNLENYGVQEMNINELASVEGGSVARWVYRAALAVAELILEDPSRTVSSGWDSTPYGHYGGARP